MREIVRVGACVQNGKMTQTHVKEREREVQEEEKRVCKVQRDYLENVQRCASCNP